MFNFDSKFFEKHQAKLLFIANKWYLRWLLGLNRLPKEIKGKRIDKITPNSIHHFIGKPFSKKGKYKQKITAEFYTRPRFAEALAYNLSPFCYFQELRSKRMVWRFSPAGLAYLLFFGLLGKFAGLPIVFMGTTTNYTIGSGAGYVQTIRSSYSSAHDATTGDVVAYNTAEGYCMNSYVGGNYYIARSFFPIDTSALTSGATISSASLYVWANSKDDLNSDFLRIVQTSQASTSSLVANDFNDMGTAVGGSLDLTNFSLSNFNGISLDATGISWISKTGVSMLGMRMGGDVTNSTPSNESKLSNIGLSTSAYDVYLSVTYTLPQSVTVSDTLALTGTTQNLRGILSLISDSIGLTGSFAVIRGLIASVSDSIGLTGTITSLRGLISDVMESISLSETMTFLKGVFLDLSDSIGLTEAISNLRNLYSSVSDSFSISETIESLRSMLISASDSIGLSGTFSFVKSLYIDATDAINSSDIIIAVKGLFVDISDSMNLTSLATFTRNLLSNVNDSIGITDTIQTIRELLLDIYETISSNDFVTATRELLTNISDSINLTSQITALRNLLADISDNIGLTGAVQTIKILYIDAVDSLGLTEVMTSLRNLVISVLSALGLAELFNITKPSDSIPTIAVPIELFKANIDISLLKADIGVEIKGSNQDINL